MKKSENTTIKIPFNFEEWLNNQDRMVVDNFGKPVRVKDLMTETVLKMEENGKLFFLDEVPVRSTYLIRQKECDVSEHAKIFQKSESEHTKKEVLKCAEWFMGLVGYFGHYAFFTKELWRKVEGFKNADRAEVMVDFMQWWFRYEYGWQEYPCGCGWCNGNPSVYNEEDEIYEDHIEKLRPLFEAYSEWCYKQR